MLRRDVENYGYLESARGTVAGIDAFVRRSCFKHMATLQVYDVLRESGFNLTQGARSGSAKPRPA